VWQISLAAGKNAGNFADSAFFAKIRLDPVSCESIPYETEQGIISREQGIVSALSTGAGKSARSRFSSPDEARTPIEPGGLPALTAIPLSPARRSRPSARREARG
jgi:hypothetical protein